MRKNIVKLGFLLALAFILVGCNSKDTASTEPKEVVSPYKEFDKVAEEYFIAHQIEDFDTMKKYLSKSEIEDSVQLTEAKKGEVLHPEYKEKLEGRYKITGFDYYYKSHKQIIYLVDFFDPGSGNPHRYGIYAVEKSGDKYSMMSSVNFMISGLHFKNETGDSYLRISTVKDLMEMYPDNVYQVNKRKTN